MQVDLPAPGPLPAAAAVASPMLRSARFVVPAEIDSISPVAEALRAFIDRHLPEETCNAIELGTVEALTNVVKHGYAGMAPGAMELSFEQSPSIATVEIVDRGQAIPILVLTRASSGCFDFDPLAIDDLPQGGMGLAIIKGLFDSVRYESEGGTNRLTLALRIPKVGTAG